MESSLVTVGTVRPEPRVPTGRLGMWCFLATEFAVFTGLVVVYLASRRTDWAAEREALGSALGASGTALLLASCVAIAQAHAAARRQGRTAALLWLGTTLVLGAAFLACTGTEYARALAAGHGPGEHRFFAHWYLMTGMHVSRLLAGLVAMAGLLPAVARGVHLGRIGTLGLYWQFLGLVWCVYFPLLYAVP